MPWLAELLKRCTQLQAELNTLTARAQLFEMNRYDLKGETHAAKIDALVALIEKKTEEAKAAAPKKEGE